MCEYDATKDAVGVNKPQCANGGDFNGITTKPDCSKGCGVITYKGEDIDGDRVDYVERDCYDATYPGEGCLTVESDVSTNTVKIHVGLANFNFLTINRKVDNNISGK